MTTCPNCKSTASQVEVGITESGLYEYQCNDCGQSYTAEPNREETQGMQTAGPGAIPIHAETVPAASAARNHWGWLAEIALFESFALLLLAWAFMGARQAMPSSGILWWFGLAILILPVMVRLASANAARQERIALVLLLGMALYLVKVMHSPMAFTFPDELSHSRNVTEILESGRLFQANPIQPVTAFYPGLATVTSTLSRLTGLSIFHGGILVIGAARLLLFLGLYLLFEQVSGSARIAGLATVLYMCNPNFLYWTAEFAYEPLALPLLVFVLLIVAKREMDPERSHSRAWSVAALLGVFTVVITHHMSSYILTLLLMLVVFITLIDSRGRRWGPWKIGLVALLAASMWFLFVADLTAKYLTPVLSGAAQSVMRMIAAEETSRELFKSTSLSGESRAPIWEQIVAIGSVAVIILGLPLGILEIWKQHRHKVFALVFAVIGLAYLPAQLLRLSRAGWETANRSSEFLFIGVGFVLAVGIVRFWLTNWTGPKSKMLLAGLSIALFFGGLIAGWPPRARLARPYAISAGDHLIRPQVVTVAEWMARNLGPDNRVAASKADAKVIGAYGQYPFTDNGPIKNMFLSEEFGSSERHTLIKREIQYIVTDRKIVSWDHMIGYYFYSSQSERQSELQMMDPDVAEKLDGLENVSRLLDSGDIVIYAVEPYLSAYKISAETARSDPPVAAASHHSTGLSAGGSGNLHYAAAVTWYSSLGADLSSMDAALPIYCTLSSIPNSMDADSRLLWSFLFGGSRQFGCPEGSVR